MFSTELIDILKTLSSEVFVVTGNFFPNSLPSHVKIVNVDSPIIESTIETIGSKMYRFLMAQFRISKEVARISDRIDAAFLFLSAPLIFLPTILLRIYRKRLLVIVTGSGSQSIKRMYPTLSGKIFSLVFRLIEHFNYVIADKIIVYSPSMVTAMELDKYREKILTDGYQSFVDVKRFRIMRELEERANVMGYIGRLTAEKGVLEFAKAIPLALSRKEDLQFLLIGDGPLLGDIKIILKENGCLDKVAIVGWVPNDIIPTYLNEMKLLVLPSHTEGLPKIILEAMACGAITLANSVGAVPDIVLEGKTGFLLKNNSPLHIANKLIEVLNSDALVDIQRRASSLVRKKYTYEEAVERYRHILRRIDYDT
jgi:glycosyltransferase involved in cell wall biosynthesis